jgi:tetratricopeptide (TPR) repeat protein
MPALRAISRSPRLARGSAALVAIVVLASCASAPRPAPALPDGAEAISLLGDTLRPAPLPPETRARFERQLADARASAAADPGSADAAIWVGRRTAYLGRYNEAIGIFSDAIARHPGDARLYRHRGHRYITTRRFAEAERDLARAAALTEGRPDEIEPDGLPNARNIPTSTLQSNIWYHLGLARYAQGDFTGALDAYRRCMAVSNNPDMMVATTYWLYLTLRRFDRHDEARAALAPVRRDLEIIENDSYHRLLLVFRGELPADSVRGSSGDAALDDATTGYGLGAWHLVEGRRAEAESLFRRVVANGNWPSFGYVAAEAELARMRR